MFLPDGFGVALAFAIVSTFCWGTWANTMKMSNTRFELYYYDYTFGLFLFALAFGLIFGGSLIDDSNDPKNFPWCLRSLDNVRVVYALGAGVAFNIANFILIAAIEIVGLAIAFPAGIGISLVLGTVVNYILVQSANPAYLFSGLGLAFLAVICNAFAYKFRKQTDNDLTEALIQENPTVQKRKFSTSFGISLCVACGLLMGIWSPLATQSMKDGAGQLSPYTAFFFMTFSVLVTTFPICYIFSKRPLVGENFVPSKEYFLGGWKWHFLSFAGGFLWGLGTLFNLLGSGHLGFASSYAIGQTAPLIAALWGIFVWKEFKNPGWLVIILLILTFALYGGAIALISLSSV